MIFVQSQFFKFLVKVVGTCALNNLNLIQTQLMFSDLGLMEQEELSSFELELDEWEDGPELPLINVCFD
jgi:hypothetical protein